MSEAIRRGLRPYFIDDAVHGGCDSILVVLGDKISQCPCIKLATRGIQAPSKVLAPLEYIVRYRDSCFHTGSITRPCSAGQGGGEGVIV